MKQETKHIQRLKETRALPVGALWGLGRRKRLLPFWIGYLLSIMGNRGLNNLTGMFLER